MTITFVKFYTKKYKRNVNALCKNARIEICSRIHYQKYLDIPLFRNTSAVSVLAMAHYHHQNAFEIRPINHSKNVLKLVPTVVVVLSF